MKIVLLGYMGSGKTTVGEQLAKRLALQFLDLDVYIEEKEEKSIPEIFGDRGELYFRKQEHRYLGEILNGQNNFVLSVGGGTPCYGENLKIILSGSRTVFYLRVPIEQLALRLSQQKAHRPLISHIPDKELPEFIGKHLFERSIFYNQAHEVIDCGNRESEYVVEDILSVLNKVHHNQDGLNS